MYYIIRINFKGETEAHSIEQREDLRQALTRYYNIIAADLGNAEVTYCYAGLMGDGGRYVTEPFIFSVEKDSEGYPVTSFENIVIRTYTVNGQASNSIEYKNFNEAQQRYFNIIAADLQNANASFNMAAILNNHGEIIESRSFVHEVVGE